MKCPHCSFDNRDDAPFCEGCGHVFLSGDRLPEVPDPAELERRREAALTDIPPIVQVPDIAPADVTGAIRKKPTVPEVIPSAAPADRTSVAHLVDPLPEPPREPDFSGFERLVDSSYVPPTGVTAGDTAEIPVIRDEYVPRPRNYTLGLSPREQRKRDREQHRLEKKFAKAQRKEERQEAKKEALREREAARAALEEEKAKAQLLQQQAAEEAERRAEEARRASDEPPTAQEHAAISSELPLATGVEADAPSPLPAMREASSATSRNDAGQSCAADSAALPPADLEAVLSTGEDVVTLFEKSGKRRAAKTTGIRNEALELPGANQGLALVGERSIESAKADGKTGPAALAVATDDGNGLLAGVEASCEADEGPKADREAGEERDRAMSSPNSSASSGNDGHRGAGTDEEGDPSAVGEHPKAREKSASSAASAQAKARPPRSKAPIAVAVAIALVVAIGLVGTGTYLAEVWGGKTIPDVAGMSEEEAVAALGEKGFSATATEVKSDEAAGTVLSEAPAAGTRAEAGSTIALEIAIPRVVPDIKGMNRDEAAEALSAEGFTSVEFKEKKSNKNEGTVLKVSPKAGTEASSAEPISVTVAIPFVVPEVEGKSRDEAIAALEGEGYEVKTQQYYTEDVEEGTAVGTDPEAGTKLASGSDVTLLVARSRGSELCELTASILPGAILKDSEGSYKVEEVKGTSYRGDGEVSYQVTARKFEVVDLPFNLGQKTYYDKSTVDLEGGIVWDDNNKVSYASPSITY